MGWLESNPNQHFDVHFALNRYPLRTMHRAVDLLVEHEMFDVVFPPGSNLPTLRVRGKIE
jgi:hypothetical protein